MFDRFCPAVGCPPSNLEVLWWRRHFVVLRTNPHLMFALLYVMLWCLLRSNRMLSSCSVVVWDNNHDGTPLPLLIGGVFAQRRHNAHTAPVITLFIPGTPLKTTHLEKRA